MLIFGASGHAKVVIESLISQSIRIDGIFDDDETKTKLLSYDIIGKYDRNFKSSEPIVVAIGNNEIRKEIVKNIYHKFGIVIHQSCLLSKSARIEEGTVIFQNTVIQPDVQIGRHCIINTSSSVDHDCILGDFVHVAPNSVLCGGVEIGNNTLVGAGATILPNIKIGANVIIGGGSIISKDIPENSIVYPVRSIINDRNK